MRNKITKNCQNCQKTFDSFPCHKRKFCSYHCARKGTKPNGLGSKRTVEQRKKISDANYIRFKDETKHPRWKGDEVGYRTLHKWVQKHLGKPHFCEICKNFKLNHRQYHWANISGEYERNVKDWKRLCVKCHKAYDKYNV